MSLIPWIIVKSFGYLLNEKQNANKYSYIRAEAPFQKFLREVGGGQMGGKGPIILATLGTTK